MSTVAVSAYFDGEQICLDEPMDLSPNTKLIVIILSKPEFDEERENWLNLSAQRLEEAYGENEPEYSRDLLKKVNPDYEGR